tara:strand:- start:328 stop:495 length:168 start_codon:yes stop_codon:yes gene_type:complete
MDKETLIKLAQPAANFALAISIVSIPLIAKASMDIPTTYFGGGRAIRVYHANSCN